MGKHANKLSWASIPGGTPEVYIRIESSTVYVALNLNECSVCGQPEYFSYFSEDNSGNEDFITMVLCFLWPVTIIAGIIWGYATRKEAVCVWLDVVHSTHGNWSNVAFRSISHGFVDGSRLKPTLHILKQMCGRGEN